MIDQHSLVIQRSQETNHTGSILEGIGNVHIVSHESIIIH